MQEREGEREGEWKRGREGKREREREREILKVARGKHKLPSKKGH